MARVIENPKDLIMNKAKEILLTQGYSKLSMRALSKSCDIAIGTIYNYYPNKKDLIVEMMVEYWEQFFKKIDEVIIAEKGFQEKLDSIFIHLKGFINNFRQIWLKPELYSHPDYIETGLVKQNVFIDRLVIEIEKLLVQELVERKIEIELDTYETSKFIVMNFISVIQMPYFEYSSFKQILSKLLK